MKRVQVDLKCLTERVMIDYMAFIKCEGHWVINYRKIYGTAGFMKYLRLSY